MDYFQTDFFRYDEGVANIHTLNKVSSRRYTLVTTDQGITFLEWNINELKYQIKSMIINDVPCDIQIMGSGMVECCNDESRDTLAIAYADMTSSSSSSVSEKMYLLMIKKSRWQFRNIDSSLDKSSSAEASVRFELTSAPTCIFSMNAKTPSGDVFHGIILFRTDSLVAFGYVDEKGAEEISTQCIRLSNEQMSHFFPEFASFNHPVLSIDCLTVPSLQDEERYAYVLIAFGCVDGIIRVFRGRKQENDFIGGPYEVKDFQTDGPVTSVFLFLEKDQLVNLLATCALGSAVVYENVYPTDDSKCLIESLKGSDDFSAILSGVAADINIDGQVELLICTNAQKILSYKRFKNTSTSDSSEVPMNQDAKWRLITSRKEWHAQVFGCVYGLLWRDIDQDGIEELIVAGSSGVLVFQVAPDSVLAKIDQFPHRKAKRSIISSTQPTTTTSSTIYMK